MLLMQKLWKKSGSDRLRVMYCSNNLFPFTTVNNLKLYQITIIVTGLTAILLRHIQHYESRIIENKSLINHKNLRNCSYESCPMESSAGGTVLYISNHLSYEPRNGLCIYKSIE